MKIKDTIPLSTVLSLFSEEPLLVDPLHSDTLLVFCNIFIGLSVGFLYRFVIRNLSLLKPNKRQLARNGKGKRKEEETTYK
jgi:hypothetical protein